MTLYLHPNFRQWLFFAILLLMLIMMLTSCSASWHIKRAKRLDPSLFDTTQVVKTDTIYIKDALKDTVTVFKENVRDSIIFKDKTKVKYLIKSDTIELEVQCPDQIVVKDSIFVTNTVTVKESFIKKVGNLWWLLLVGIILGLLTIPIIRK